MHGDRDQMKPEKWISFSFENEHAVAVYLSQCSNSICFIR